MNAYTDVGLQDPSQDTRENPLRNPFINIMAVLAVSVRLLWGLDRGCPGSHGGNHGLLERTPRFPQGFPPAPPWDAWARKVVDRQLTPYMTPEQVKRLNFRPQNLEQDSSQPTFRLWGGSAADPLHGP